MKTMELYSGRMSATVTLPEWWDEATEADRSEFLAECRPGGSMGLDYEPDWEAVWQREQEEEAYYREALKEADRLGLTLDDYLYKQDKYNQSKMSLNPMVLSDMVGTESLDDPYDLPF